MKKKKSVVDEFSSSKSKQPPTITTNDHKEKKKSEIDESSSSKSKQSPTIITTNDKEKIKSVDNNNNSAIQKFVSLFLEGVKLQKFMKYMCETGMGQSVDPITDVVCVMITCPLQLVITEVGVAPFKVQNFILFYFILFK